MESAYERDFLLIRLFVRCDDRVRTESRMSGAKRRAGVGKQAELGDCGSSNGTVCGNYAIYTF